MELNEYGGEEGCLNCEEELNVCLECKGCEYPWYTCSELATDFGKHGEILRFSCEYCLSVDSRLEGLHVQIYI